MIDKGCETIKAVLWDIDGVQVLSEPLHVEKITAVARDPLGTGADDPVRGVRIAPEDWRELHGIGDHRVHAWLMSRNPDFPLTCDEFLKACEKYYIGRADTLAVRDGFLAAFDLFDRAGLPQGNVSSGVRSQVEANMRVTGTRDRVAFAISADDVAHTKPHPEPFLKGYEKMLALKFNGNSGIFQPRHCLVIGDSGSDIKSGTAAGMVTALWKLAAGPDDVLAAYNLEPDAAALMSLARAVVRDDPVALRFG